MMNDLVFQFPELPVSVNNLYRVYQGRKVLSKKGKAFRNKFIASGGGLKKTELAFFNADNDQKYQVHLWYFLPFSELYNVGYGKDKRTKSPFKDVDVDNMAKLALDCIAALVGIRDRNNFTVCLHKREAPTRCLVAVLQPLDLEEEDPYPPPVSPW